MQRSQYKGERSSCWVTNYLWVLLAFHWARGVVAPVSAIASIVSTNAILVTMEPLISSSLLEEDLASGHWVFQFLLPYRHVFGCNDDALTLARYIHMDPHLLPRRERS